MKIIVRSHNFFVVFIIFLAVGFSVLATEMPPPPLSQLFDATHLIRSCPIAGNTGYRYGTILLISCSIDSTKLLPAFLTARHVLDSISSDSAEILFHKKDNLNDTVWVKIAIKKNGKPRYVVHPDSQVDLAAMYMDKGAIIGLNYLFVQKEVFATPEDFEHLMIHPGDQVFYLGFPRNLGSPAGGYPLLRSGFIASYPLIPPDKMKKFYIDGLSIGRNSGGPVIFSQDLRTDYRNRTIKPPPKILGIITDGDITEISIDDSIKLPQMNNFLLAAAINSYYVQYFFESLKCK